jgi:hypothetical protein
MNVITFLKQSLPDAHKVIFDFHKQLAIDTQEDLISDLVYERDILSKQSLEDYNLFDEVYGLGERLTPEEFREHKCCVSAQIFDESSRLVWLHSFCYAY